MPVEEIRPGMEGETWTVLRGTEVVRLRTEILGVEWNTLGPGRHLIIGRLIDPRTTLSGAVHGMSGSPLWIQGRLVGALSRRLAMFEKDGHCGFTPIKDMEEVLKNPAENWRRAPQSEARGGSVFGEWLSIPLAVSGISDEGRAALAKVLGENSGWHLVAGGSVGVSDRTFPFGPGSPVSVVLARGDISAVATGTVTWVDGRGFSAFGHSMMGLGPVRLPVASAEIVTVVPSFQRPYKLANAGAIGGVVTQDRLSAIAGRWNETAPMASYRVRRVREGKKLPEWRGQLTADPGAAVMALRIVAAGALFDPQLDHFRFQQVVRGELHLEGLPSLKIAAGAAGSGADRFQVFLNTLKPAIELLERFPGDVLVRGVDLEVQTEGESEVWEVVGLSTGVAEVKRGESVAVEVRLRESGGAERREVVRFKIPERVQPGVFRVWAGGNGEWMNRRTRGLNRPGLRNPEAMIRAWNEGVVEEGLQLVVFSSERMQWHQGVQYPAMPLSVEAVLRVGEVQSVEGEVVLEHRTLPWSGWVFGSQEQILNVER